MEHKNEGILGGNGIRRLEFSCYWLHPSKMSTKVCSQERIKKEQQTSNGYHLRRITRVCEKQNWKFYFSQRGLGQAEMYLHG